MGFLSDTFKKIVKVVTAPAKAIWKGIKKVGKAVWKGVKKVLASKVFKIGMLILSVVGVGAALAAGFAAFSAAGGFGNIISSALQGGGAMLNSLTGGVAGKIGGAVKGVFGGSQAATSTGQVLAQSAGPLSAAKDAAAGAAGNLLSSGGNAAQVGQTVSLGQKLSAAPSQLVEAFQGYAQTAMDFVTSVPEKIESTYNAVKANVFGTDPAAGVTPTQGPVQGPTPAGTADSFPVPEVLQKEWSPAGTGLPVPEVLQKGWKPAGPLDAAKGTVDAAGAATTTVEAATKGSKLWEAAQAVLPSAGVALGQGLSGYAQGRARQEELEQQRKEQEQRDREFTGSVASGRFEEQVGGFGINLGSKWTDERRFPSMESRFRTRFSGEAA